MSTDNSIKNLDEAFRKAFGHNLDKEVRPLPGMQEKRAAALKGRADWNAVRPKQYHDGRAWTMRDYSPTEVDKDEQDLGATLRKKGLHLEKPQGSSLHHALEEFKKRGMPDELLGYFATEFQSFVIQHDWARAFDHAEDFSGGEVRLPFDFVAFEFRVTSHRIIVMLGDGGDGIFGAMFTGINGRWYMPSANLEFKNGELIDRDAREGFEVYAQGRALLKLLGDQIRAVCVVLEAEVAEAEVVRAPNKLQEKRRREGKSPMKNYHVVSLARRHRVAPPENSGPSDRKRPRCHYRRGHWRHFADHRTWIKWMLVGNPDLGFVDKEYRL